MPWNVVWHFRVPASFFVRCLSRKNFSSLSPSSFTSTRKFFFFSRNSLIEFSLSPLSTKTFSTPTFSVLISFHLTPSHAALLWLNSSSNTRNRAQNLYIRSVISVFSVQLTHTLTSLSVFGGGKKNMRNFPLFSISGIERQDIVRRAGKSWEFRYLFLRRAARNENENICIELLIPIPPSSAFRDECLPLKWKFDSWKNIAVQYCLLLVQVQGQTTDALMVNS